MVTIDEFSRVVSEIYASSISPANWPVALTDVGRIIDATGCAIFIGRGPTRSLMNATVPSEAAEPYIEHFYAIDYILDAVEKGPGGLIHGGRALAEATFRVRDGLHASVSHGRRNIRTTVRWHDAHELLAAAPKGREPFNTAERVKFMGALIRHLQQALRTQDHLAELSEAAIDITEVIDAIRHGIVIIGNGRGVVHLNSAAAHILKSGDGLCIRAGSIEATRTATNEQLQTTITRALVEQQFGPRGGDSFACGRPSGKRPYILHVLPLSVTSDDLPTATALVMIIDPEQEPEPPKMLIQRLFGPTNAEADVALRVMRGDGLKPISADLALSRATVNTHLQHIFDKTDTPASRVGAPAAGHYPVVALALRPDSSTHNRCTCWGHPHPFHGETRSTRFQFCGQVAAASRNIAAEGLSIGSA